MTSLLQIPLCVVTIALAGALAGCADEAGPASAQSPSSPQATVVANDCRSPNALSSQRGCRPATRVMGSL